MIHPAALVLLVAATAGAAPVPLLAPRKFENFGTAIESKGATCTTTKPGELRISAFKEAATVSSANCTARPLVARTVEGDFELTVRIAHAPPSHKNLAAIGRGDPSAAAGIALYDSKASKGSVVFLHRNFKDGDAWQSTFGLYSRYADKGSDALRIGEDYLDQPIYLRLVRRGDEFTGERSHDGKQWTSLFSSASDRHGRTQLGHFGPAAVHNTNGRYDVIFDEYVLTQSKGAKK